MRRSFCWLMWWMCLLLAVGLACNLQTTPAPPPTATPVPQFCRDFVTLDPPPRPAAAASYESTIADFLTAGGSPDDLEAVLRSWGVHNDTWGSVDASQDLTHDGRLDFVVTLSYEAAPRDSLPPGHLLVFSCQDTDNGNLAYQTLYGLSTASGDVASMPTLIHVGDLTGDGHPEIAFYTEYCATLACYREPYVMTWNPDEGNFRPLHNQFATTFHNTDDGEAVRGFPFAGFEMQESPGGQPPQLIIQEGEILLREAGPQRAARYIWTWNGFEYADPVVQWPPAYFRLHAVQDADQRFLDGDLATASTMYTQTLNNRDLAYWGGITQTDGNIRLEERSLDSYTRYRLVLIHAAENNDQAQAMFDIMESLTPFRTGDVPSYYTVLAETFLSTFYDEDTSGDPLNAACQEVLELARNDWMAATYGFFGDEDFFGLAAQPYNIEDLCPF